MATCATQPATISVDDFMTGLLAALAGRGLKAVSIRDIFYKSIEKAFQQFESEATAGGFEVDFVVKAHPVHGDSPTVRMAITHAVQRDLVSLDNPVYLDMRLKIGRSFADDYLQSLPGSPDWYIDAASTFLTEFSAQTGV